MEAIADKIRHYRAKFRPPIFYALDSLVLWISIGLAAAIIGLLFVDLYLRIADNAYLLELSDQAWLLASEVPMVFGFMQAYLHGLERRCRTLNTTAKTVHFRRSLELLTKEKLACLHATFDHDNDLRIFAKNLIEEWEWRRDLRLRAREPLERAAWGFFRLPSAANFAAYLTGLVAVVAGIVIATLSSDAIFGDLDQFLTDAWHLILKLWLVVVAPFALCVVPGTLILVGIKQIGEAILEQLNDQFLSHTAFYRFISEILELHDRGEPMLLRKTRAWAYWTIRLTTAHLKDFPRICGRVRRARVRAKVTRRFSTTSTEAG